MTIKDKWKAFAVKYVFSDDLTNEAARDIYNDLWELDTSDKVEEYLEQHEYIVWAHFEGSGGFDLVNHITSLAQFAQETESEEV